MFRHAKTNTNVAFGFPTESGFLEAPRSRLWGALARPGRLPPLPRSRGKSRRGGSGGSGVGGGKLLQLLLRQRLLQVALARASPPSFARLP